MLMCTRAGRGTMSTGSILRHVTVASGDKDDPYAVWTLLIIRSDYRKAIVFREIAMQRDEITTYTLAFSRLDCRHPTPTRFV